MTHGDIEPERRQQALAAARHAQELTAKAHTAAILFKATREAAATKALKDLAGRLSTAIEVLENPESDAWDAAALLTADDISDEAIAAAVRCAREAIVGESPSC